ncbi:MAG TPA: outer membrane beta-barrel protein [Bacteroidales bacterium]|nr:outer membrane beta-barrel protein [Bacteroidales bacterium]
MKKIYLLGIVFLVAVVGKSQDVGNTALINRDDNAVVSEDSSKAASGKTANEYYAEKDSDRQILGDRPKVVKTNGDTTRIALGKKGITIVEKNGKTTVQIDNIENDKDNNDNSNNDSYPEVPEAGFPRWQEHKFHSPKFEPHWAGIEIFLNNFVTSGLSLNLPKESQFLELDAAKSIGVRVNILEFPIAITNEQGFSTGLGFEFNSYYFSSDTNNIQKSNGYIVYKNKPAGAGNYSKNKIKDTYLNVPLFYEIQFPLGSSKRPLYFSFGVIGGLKLGSTTKEYYTLNGEDKKDITKGDFYMSPIRLAYQARIGYRRLHLFATYYDTPFFRKGKGPEVHPFDIGIMLLNW